MGIRAALVLILFLLPGLAAAGCQSLTHEGRRYTVCSFDPAQTQLRMFLRDDTGQIIGSFARLEALLDSRGQAPVFAMNGGMYHPDRAPVGLYIEDGQVLTPTVARAGPGNFGMLPNGILCLADGRAEVIETRRYLDRMPECRHATQSGPMLVIDGALHPRFLPDSTSRHIRNGVGVDADGRVHFAISARPVTFHEFARLFRDVLGTPQALYLDGKISRLFAPEINRADGGLPMGPIVAAVADAPR
ncbi:phosphodiester glycosidase family protein [Rhodovulum adriaticum]|uniref:Uncharacterized protein YigE (DUF2233 family) n=1 Tax=Rhodovulum adriaticum TaxID=35804 RepID=A0A4R2NYH6_RHOAD|nr:phosphodiester glycosidase family protein [Rhodovulum adriaticum]MBK1634285.1 hypothetical protein [Rhodovulum adriaticum]TCP27162.1 uncharacterized protein YigE (DUF2233 family) [Rhodovulum adriaticum]